MTPVYLEDFVVLKPPEEWTVDVDATVEAASRWKVRIHRRDPHKPPLAGKAHMLPNVP